MVPPGVKKIEVHAPKVIGKFSVLLLPLQLIADCKVISLPPSV